MKKFLLAIVALFFGIIFSQGQSLNKTWKFDSYENPAENINFKIPDTSLLKLKDGAFTYTTNSSELKSSGNYIYQNNLIIFYYGEPNDTIRKYTIKELSDSTMVLVEKNITYK